MAFLRLLDSNLSWDVYNFVNVRTCILFSSITDCWSWKHSHSLSNLCSYLVINKGTICYNSTEV